MQNRIVLTDRSFDIELNWSADNISVTWTHKSSGYVSHSPLLELDVHSKMERRLDVIRSYNIEAFEGGTTARVTVSDRFRGICLSLILAIENEELVVRLHPVEMYEDRPELYRLWSVNILPQLMSADASGSLLLPLGAGVRCGVRDKAALKDRFLIYGEQPRWELLPTLPFCAVEHSARPIMALATAGACDMQCRAEITGEDTGTTGFAFSFRQHWNDPIDYAPREIRYKAIPPGERVDLCVASRLRRHIMEDLGKSTLTERAAESPEVKYLLSAYIMKLFHSIQTSASSFQVDSENPNERFHVAMTFEEAAKSLQRIHNAGVDRVLTESVGWNCRGHDGMYPTRLPPEPRLGGEAGFRAMLNCGADLGFQMSVHDNYADAYRSSPDFDLDTTIIDCDGAPLVSGLWGGGINLRQWPLSFSDERLSGQMQQVRDLGVRGLYYCDAMGNPLEVNYHPKNGGPRSDHARGIQRVLKEARRVAGAAGTEAGFLYCAIDADCIAMNGYENGWFANFPEWPVVQMIDEHVPIWQLALHGLVLLEGHGLTWPDVMRKVLFGNHPRTEWSTHPGAMPVLDDAMVAALKADYDMTLVRFGRLQTLQMSDHQRPAPGIETSRFEDGTEVIADFNANRLTVNGEEVVKPNSLM